MVMKMIAEANLEIGELVRSIMNEYLCFLVPSKTDTNKRRWMVWGFWSNFLGNVSGAKLNMQPLEKTVERTKKMDRTSSLCEPGDLR